MKVEYRQPTRMEPFCRLRFGGAEAAADVLDVTDTAFAARGDGFEIRGRVLSSTRLPSLGLVRPSEAWYELELTETRIDLNPSSTPSPFLTALAVMMGPVEIDPGVTVSSPGFPASGPVDPIVSPPFEFGRPNDDDSPESIASDLLRAALVVDDDAAENVMRRALRSDPPSEAALVASASVCAPAERNRELPDCFPSRLDPVVEIVRRGELVTTGRTEDNTGVYVTGNISLGEVLNVRINGSRPIYDAVVTIEREWVTIKSGLLTATVPYAEVELRPWLTPIDEWDDDEVELTEPSRQRWVHRYYAAPDERGPIERALG